MLQLASSGRMVESGLSQTAGGTNYILCIAKCVQTKATHVHKCGIEGLKNMRPVPFSAFQLQVLLGSGWYAASRWRPSNMPWPRDPSTTMCWLFSQHVPKVAVSHTIWLSVSYMWFVCFVGLTFKNTTSFLPLDFGSVAESFCHTAAGEVHEEVASSLGGFKCPSCANNPWRPKQMQAFLSKLSWQCSVTNSPIAMYISPSSLHLKASPSCCHHWVARSYHH